MAVVSESDTFCQLVLTTYYSKSDIHRATRDLNQSTKKMNKSFKVNVYKLIKQWLTSLETILGVQLICFMQNYKMLYAHF